MREWYLNTHLNTPYISSQKPYYTKKLIKAWRSIILYISLKFNNQTESMLTSYEHLQVETNSTCLPCALSTMNSLFIGCSKGNDWCENTVIMVMAWMHCFLSVTQICCTNTLMPAAAVIHYIISKSLLKVQDALGCQHYHCSWQRTTEKVSLFCPSVSLKTMT